MQVSQDRSTLHRVHAETVQKELGWGDTIPLTNWRNALSPICSSLTILLDLCLNVWELGPYVVREVVVYYAPIANYGALIEDAATILGRIVQPKPFWFAMQNDNDNAKGRIKRKMSTRISIPMDHNDGN